MVAIGVPIKEKEKSNDLTGQRADWLVCGK